MIFDPQLIRTVETSAARVSVATVESYVALDAGDPARSRWFGSGALVVFGPGRFVNRAIGVSIDEIDDEQLTEMEAFFADCGVPAAMEVSAWAPAALLRRLAERGYTLSWFRNVYVALLDEPPRPGHPGMRTREVDDASLDEWMAVLRAGNDLVAPEAVRVSDEYARAVHDVDGATDYLADLDGLAVGCASLIREDSVAWLGGAATIAAYRQRGVQGALVRHRMAAAHESGCEVVVATAMPAGGSARNLARLGFTLVQTQAVLTKS